VIFFLASTPHRGQAAGPMALIFEAPVAHFTQTIKEYGERQKVGG